MNNKTKKQSLYLFFLVLLTPMVYGITLDQLVNSYDYSYDSADFELLSITAYGEDVDSNLLYDFLVLNITMDTKFGEHSIIGDLFVNDTIANSEEIRPTLSEGVNTVQLRYNASTLLYDTYNLSLTIKRNFLVQYRKEDVMEITLNKSQYELPAFTVGVNSYVLNDTDADTQYEFLDVVLDINALAAGTYAIFGYITDDQNTVSYTENYTLSTGNQQIVLKFNGSEIRKKRLNTSRLYQVVIKDNPQRYEFNFNYPITYTLSQFDAEQSILSGNYEDGVSDTDGDGLFDYFSLNVSFDADAAGVYTVETALYDEFGTYLKKLSRNVSVASVGTYTVELRINGSEMFTRKVDGPYDLLYVSLAQDGVLVDNEVGPYQTGQHVFDDFERPKMPDLDIFSLTYDINSGIASLDIKNIGNLGAYGVTISLFDQNFELLRERIIPYILPTVLETWNADLGLSNITTLYAIVDYYGSIEESNEDNNDAIWPFETEVNISIYSGWNLISMPTQLPNTSVKEVLKDIDGKYIGVFLYNASDPGDKWKVYDPARPSFLNTLDEIPVQNGFWLEATANTSLFVNETPVNETLFSIVSGWNLVSYLTYDSIISRGVFQNVNTSYNLVYAYDASVANENLRWLSHDINRPEILDSLQVINPGFGLWVNASAGTWNFTNGGFS